MIKAPYSLSQATMISKDHQHLLGERFSTSGDLRIECVTITPFDEINKERFLILYFLLNNAERALANEYDGANYNVLVIGRSVSDPHELQQEDLQTWLIRNNRLAVEHA